MSEIDWAVLQKEAATAGLLPDGDYSVIIADATAATSSNGKPMIKFKARVTEGPHKDKPVWGQFTISAESAIALRIFFQQMAILGLGADFFAQNPSTEVVASNLRNRGAVFTLGHRSWQGQDRNNVEGIRALPVGGPTPPGLVVGPPTVGVTPTSGPPVPSPTVATPVPTGAPSPLSAPPAPPTQPF